MFNFSIRGSLPRRQVESSKGDNWSVLAFGFFASFIKRILPTTTWHSLIVVQLLLSCVRLFVTPLTAAHQASLSSTMSWSLLKLMSIESMMPSNHLVLCHPLFPLSSILPSISVFSSELALCIRWQKDWSSNFSISPSNEYSGLISFRTDWFDLLTVHGTFKSLLQHQSSTVL